jgi:hypothetical protein
VSVSELAIWHRLRIDDVCSPFCHSADRRSSLIYAASSVSAPFAMSNGSAHVFVT